MTIVIRIEAQDVHGRVRRTGRDTPANVAVLKNGRAKAVRFSSLEHMCEVLDCQPGDLLEWVPKNRDV